jgi:hypothetical protein
VTRRRGRHSLGVVTITTAQALAIAQALADADSYRRQRVEAYCYDCHGHPAGAWDDHLDDLDQASKYAALLDELGEGSDDGR